MSTQALAEQFTDMAELPHAAPLPDTIGFSRLRALARRGYRPLFDREEPAAAFVSLTLEHPRKNRADAPPALTLWSDGTIATSKVLWPLKYVPTEDGPPDWQKYIRADDRKAFDSFTSSIHAPTTIDLVLMPALRESKMLAAMFVFGSMLCVSIAAAIQLVTYLI